MLMERAHEHRSLRAPSGDGQTLVEPPLESLPVLAAQSRQAIARVDYDMQGRTLADLSASARIALIDRALKYTEAYRDVPTRWRDAAFAGSAPLILSGHQPQLFHPGVWYKNFVLGDLAKQTDGIGVHLLIDSDLCRSASVRVPTGTTNDPRLEAVAYDTPAVEVPYEERSIGDDDAFASFGAHAAKAIRPLVRDPLIDELWPITLQRAANQANLGLRLAQGRHALEGAWGNDTLELPQSSVCQLPEFAWFAAHLLANLPRFWSAYNDALAAYRVTHRQRSRAHPVPDLTEIDGWLEAPFWIWTADDPQRRPLFARQSGDEILVTDRNTHTIALSLSADGDAATAAEQLLAASAKGIKIRTRALTTTLFARMMLSDLFLHGIGGAKYDQVTDQIARSFFGFQLPAFAAVSATLRLPIEGRSEIGDIGGGCLERMRELRYHPERFLKPASATSAHMDSQAQRISADKLRWVGVSKTPANAHERHTAIVAANEALQPFVVHQRQEIERQCEETRRQRRSATILNSRDYAFCLYPQAHIKTMLRNGLDA